MQAARSHTTSTDGISVIMAIRHSPRDKKNPDKSKCQILTPAGYLLANTLGVLVHHCGMPIESIHSSDQDRAIYTAKAFIDGYNQHAGEHVAPSYTSILADENLGDFSGSIDKFEIIRAAIEASKPYAKEHDIDTEEAVFQTPEGREALMWRAIGYRSSFLEMLKLPGFHPAFCHAPVLDAAVEAMAVGDNWQLGEYPKHPIGYCEGAVIIGLAGEVKAVFQYKYPDWETLRHFLDCRFLKK